MQKSRKSYLILRNVKGESWLMTWINEKAFRETQTLRAGYSKAEPKKFHTAADPFPWARDGQNLITYKPSLVRIDARNFELSW